MTKKLAIALAACLLLLPTSIFPADADVLYSLTGTVGDTNWLAADPDVAGPGSLELFRNLFSVFQYNGGPGGLITVDFSGPPIFASRDQVAYSFLDMIATCRNLSGCDASDYSYFIQREGGVQLCCLMYPIDSSFHVQPLDTPPFAPYGATFIGYQEGYVGFYFDAIVTADAAGQPFSLTVNTVSPIPEPPVWTLMLGGLFGAGFALRRMRRNTFKSAA